MSKEKKKKPIYKKWWAWLIAFFLVGGIINGIIDPYDEEKQAEEDKQKEIEEEEKAEKEKSEKKEKEEAKKKEEERLANRDIDEALEEDNDIVKSAELNDGELTLTYEPGTVWSENSFFNTVYDSFEIVSDAFKDEGVDSVLTIIKAEMTDEKGNEELEDIINYRYTRADFDELNYDNFKEMALGQQWRILNEADGYFIHPGIRANLKDKYTDNLK